MKGYGRGVGEGQGSADNKIEERGSPRAGTGRVTRRWEEEGKSGKAGSSSEQELLGKNGEVGGVRRSGIWLGEIERGGGREMEREDSVEEGRCGNFEAGAAAAAAAAAWGRLRREAGSAAWCSGGG